MPLEAIAILMVAGAAAGVIAGLFGVGGGVIMVPLFRFLGDSLGWPADHAMHMAVATSTAAVLPTAISSARAHARLGTIDRDLVRLWGLPIALAAILAGAVAGRVSNTGLTFVFAALAAVVGVRMTTGSAWALRDKPAAPALQRTLAAAVGWFSSWMGIGAGTLGVPTMTALGVAMHRAVGTAALLGVYVSAPSLIGWLWSGRHAAPVAGPSIGFVQLLPLLAMLPPMLLLAPIGARLAKSLPADMLRRIFGLFLLCVSVALLDRALR